MLGIAFALEGTLIDSPGLLERASAELERERTELHAGGVPLSACGTDARFRQIASALASSHVRMRAGAERALSEVRSLGVPLALATRGLSGLEESKARVIGFDGPVIVREASDDDDVAFFSELCRALALPAECIWFVTADAKDAAAARACGLNAVEIRDRADEVLEELREPYTRALLNIRHIMRTALDWRPGHVVRPEDVENL